MAPHRKDPRAQEADPVAGQERNRPIDDVSDKPARGSVVRGHDLSLAAPCWIRHALRRLALQP